MYFVDVIIYYLENNFFKFIFTAVEASVRHGGQSQGDCGHDTGGHCTLREKIPSASRRCLLSIISKASDRQTFQAKSLLKS